MEATVVSDETDPLAFLQMTDDDSTWAASSFASQWDDQSQLQQQQFQQQQYQSPAAIANNGTTTVLPVVTGRPPVLLYLSCDPDSLTPYQVLVRKQIELFEACLLYTSDAADE